MREIVYNNGSTYATNNQEGGVFWKSHHLKDKAYRQLRGNSQTPTFDTAKQFNRYLIHHSYISGLKIVATHGWPKSQQSQPDQS